MLPYSIKYQLYNKVFKRWSTTAIFVLLSAYGWDTLNSSVINNWYAKKNQGRLWKDIKYQYEK